jgi:methylmalonyl-CoA mutase
VNMLRTTIAAFAAGIGGADAITVLPFTAAIGLPDRFARRVARNSQLILLEESNLARVADPAAGSGALEALTDQLGRAAWILFQEIEAAGGASAALEAGLIQHKVAEVRAKREAAIATRKDALIGTSEYPHLAEMPALVLDMPLAPLYSAPAGANPLPCIRLAEPFEQLRDASDLILAERGARPRVFLANLGAPAEFMPRAQFASNLFEAGGIEAVSNDGFESRDAMVAAFKASGTRVACLCGTDEMYQRDGVETAQVLKAAGARVHLAGRPSQADAFRAAGVDTFIFAGCDALAVLRDAYRTITETPA